MKFKLPTLHPVRLQSQTIEGDDELSPAFVTATNSADAWDLTERVDGAALQRFWEEVAQEQTSQA